MTVVMLGTAYGGHLVDTSRVGPGDVVLDVGVGPDFSFAEQLGQAVEGLRFVFADPDTQSFGRILQWMPQATLLAIAVDVESGCAVFWVQQDRSGSLVRGREKKSVDVVTRSPRDLCAEYRPRVVKLDIEGSEVQVLPLFGRESCVDQISVEFHDQTRGNVSAESVRCAVVKMADLGFDVVSTSGPEVLFVRRGFGMRCLEIGPGPNRLGKEWETLSCVSGANVDHVCVWGEQELPFPDCTFDLVYASHVLEHVPWFRTVDALREARRILKLGGVFEVFVPNFHVILDAIRDGVPADEWRKHNPDGDLMTWVNGRVFAYGGPGGNADPNWHRALFTVQSLRLSLVHSGFDEESISLLSVERGHRHGPISLGMSARK